ncbi:MAG: hypothetical protein ACYC5Y_09310 [Symbiobacteriia bacterium]
MVFIEEQAFIGMILSVIEVYRNESYGVLLGHGEPDRWVVESCIPYLTADRSPSGVEVRWRRERRLGEALGHLSTRRVIGDYHSHTAWGARPALSSLSDVDVESMSQDEIQIVVAVNDRVRAQPWRYLADGSLSGTLSNYHIKIAAYAFSEGDKAAGRRPRPVPVRCPFAIGFMAPTRQVAGA